MRVIIKNQFDDANDIKGEDNIVLHEHQEDSETEQKEVEEEKVFVKEETDLQLEQVNDESEYQQRGE